MNGVLFRTNEAILYGQWWIRVITHLPSFAKKHTTRVNTDVSYRTLGDNTVFLDCSKVPLSCGMLIQRRPSLCVGKGDLKNSVLSTRILL